MTKQKFIESFSKAFECKTRDNGKEYVILKDESFKPLFREMHGTDFMPDDFRYNTIDSIISALLDYDLDYELTLQDATEDFRHEIIDNLVPCYNHDRLQWLASNLMRADYIDQAAKDGLISNDTEEFNRIGMGMYCEIEELFNNVINVLDEHFKNENITE